MQTFTVDKPSTVFLTFALPVGRVNVFLNGRLYFFRVLGGKFKKIKFNVCHPGTYTYDAGKVEKILPIQITPLKVELPAPDRNRMKEFTITHNPELTGSPARNFTKSGRIETGTKYKLLPFPLRLFVLLHEVGHFHYKDEINCDLWAAREYIRMGYNNSMALYALTRVLNCNNGRNKQRILTLFKNLNK